MILMMMIVILILSGNEGFVWVLLIGIDRIIFHYEKGVGLRVF